MIIVPNISINFADGDFDRVRYYYERSMWISIVGTLLILLFLQFSYSLIADSLSKEYRGVSDVMAVCVMSRLVFLSTSAQQNFLRAANKPGLQALITFMTVALLPCCLLTLIGSGAKLSEVGLVYASGNLIGALFFLLTSPYALRLSLRGIGFKGFPIILSHMVLFGVGFSQIARI